MIRACSVDELPRGERMIVEVEGAVGAVGLFHTPDGYFAVRNHCPHHGAPLCVGRWGGTTVADRPYEYEYALDGRILACPWHQWEFDLKTGCALFDPTVRARTYPVVVKDGDIYIDLKGRTSHA